jgi:two-component system, chemotaxis family, chemotaxis protein CheY
MNNVCPTECKVGIAIVEDEKDLVRAYERMFHLYKITICFVAYDGLEAVKKFMECNPKPHVVIMDYRLPIMNGIDAMKEIKKIAPTAKFIFLSADPNVKDEALKAGATKFLVKPVSFKIILKEVQNIIDQATT